MKFASRILRIQHGQTALFSPVKGRNLVHRKQNIILTQFANLIESATDLIVTPCNCRYCFIHTVNSTREKPERNKTHTHARTHAHTHTRARKQQEDKHESDVKDNRIRTIINNNYYYYY